MKRYWKFGLTFAIGIAMGVVVAGIFRPGDNQPPSPTENKTTRKSSDYKESAKVAALRVRIAELEKKLAKSRKNETFPTTTGKSADSRPDRVGASKHGEDPRERMERMKKEDPARYAQHTNRMSRMRKMVAARQQETLDFLASIDVSRLSSGAKKVHEDLQDMIVRRDEIASQLQQEGLTDDERHQLMSEMHSVNRQIRDLNSSERSNLLDDTVRGLGFEGDDAKRISDGIQQVIEATDDFRMFRGARAEPPPDAPPPGGPRP